MDPPPPAVALGRYVLISRGGAPLPSALNAGPGASASLRGDTLRLLADGSFARAHHVTYCNSGFCGSISDPITGSFEVAFAKLTLSPAPSDCAELDIIPSAEPAQLECLRFGQLGVYVRDSGGAP